MTKYKVILTANLWQLVKVPLVANELKYAELYLVLISKTISTQKYLKVMGTTEITTSSNPHAPYRSLLADPGPVTYP